MKYFFITIFILARTNLFSQKGETPADTRIDNQVYWKKMGMLGRAIPNPPVIVPQSKFTGDIISSPLVELVNSPDILIDNTSGFTQSENSISIDPATSPNALNSNNSFNSTQSYLGTGHFYTLDQGQTWTGSASGLGLNLGDPSVAISNNGRNYIGHINDNGGQSVAVSTNQGASWQTYIVASVINTDPEATLDKNHLWVDRSVTSNYVNNVYTAWTNFDEGSNFSRIEFSKSVDGGVSWSSDLNISQASAGSGFDQGVNLHTGPNGEVYAVWSIYDSWPADENAIGFAASFDGGVSFIPSIRILNNIRGTRITGVGKGIGTNSFPSMAVDNSFGPNRGTIYVAWANVGKPGINSGNIVDIYLVKSTDAGSTWSLPTKVNSLGGSTTKHYLPWITCDATTGKLHIIYYDDRNVSATECETWVSSSFDGGSTWDEYKISDVSFTPVAIPGLRPGYFGDYIGISASDDIVYPVWTDNRNGIALSYTSPLISSDLCQTNLTLQNITIPIVGSYKYRAQNNINVANTGTNFILQGNGTNGARVSMVAGGDITLYDNTTVELGATLTIVPGLCNSPILKPVYYNTENKNERFQLKEFEIASNVNLYPNPLNSAFYIELSEEFFKKKRLSYEIKSLMMNTIHSGNITGRITPVDGGRLIAGAYLVLIFENNVLLETKKLIKQ